jgi:hypothetical protein
VAFSTVQKYFGHLGSDQQLLEYLPQMAVLIQGVWIVLSELLYTQRPCVSRNYLLYLFSNQSLKKESGSMELDGKDEGISRIEFSTFCHLEGELSKNMLNEIAELDSVTRKWNLKITDDSFEDMYSDLSRQQFNFIQELGRK